jgi:hypothetical protein
MTHKIIYLRLESLRINTERIFCAEYRGYFLLFNAKGREFGFYTITKFLSGNLSTL